MAHHFIEPGTLLKPEPIIISELQLHALVHGWLFAVDLQTRPDKHGKSFRQLRLRDQRGNEIKVNQFDLPRIEPLAPQKGKIVLLEGIIEEYQSKLQIKVVRAELDESAPLDMFVVSTRRTLDFLED